MVGEQGWNPRVIHHVGTDQEVSESQEFQLKVGKISHGERLEWFVPDERHAEMLVCEGVKRGRIWTARELLDVMALRDRTPELVKTLALAKIAFDGDIVEVSPQPSPGSGRSGRMDGP